jgi:hypothetical protein
MGKWPAGGRLDEGWGDVATRALQERTSALPAPTAARRVQPPSWRDARLLVGVLLVLVSVVAGALVVDRADRTVPVYAAARVLTPGTAVTQDDLTVVSVRLEGAGDRYLSAATDLAAGQVVLRTVAAGELVPRSALGARDQVDLRPVSVPVAAEVADPLGPGVLVDVWVAARDPARGSTAFAAPRQVAVGAEVSGRSTRRGALGSSTAASVQLLLTAALVPQVIEAVDNGSRITLVPVPATLPRAGT